MTCDCDIENQYLALTCLVGTTIAFCIMEVVIFVTSWSPKVLGLIPRILCPNSMTPQPLTTMLSGFEAALHYLLPTLHIRPLDQQGRRSRYPSTGATSISMQFSPRSGGGIAEIPALSGHDRLQTNPRHASSRSFLQPFATSWPI